MSLPKLAYVVWAAPAHYFPNHPECPERVVAIGSALHRIRLHEQPDAVWLEELPAQLPEGLLAAVHTQEHVDQLHATSAAAAGPTAVRDADDPDGPTFATPSSFADAMKAACAAVALLDAVVAGSRVRSGGGGCAGDGPPPPLAATSGFSLCRPPGHHATPGDQMGFCLLNNAALAARHAQRAHGLCKVLILDWDVHHGNGTQDAFYDDPSVLLIDLHQAGVWPGSGDLRETGAGEGEGATINVPLPWHSGHVAALRAWERVVEPAARRFAPDLIIVSAGYDAHHADPLEHLQWQATTYHALAAAAARLAAELCGGRLLLLLEGGYNQAALGESVAETVLALLGRPSAAPLLPREALPHPEPLQEVEAVLDAVRRLHQLET